MPTSIFPEPGENEIECARCVTFFLYELTPCPNCGVYLYEPEDETEGMESPSPTHTLQLLSGFEQFSDWSNK